MTKNTPGKKPSSVGSILLALIFAGAILISSYIMKDSDTGQTFTFLLIAVWFSMQFYPNRKQCCSHRGSRYGSPVE